MSSLLGDVMSLRNTKSLTKDAKSESELNVTPNQQLESSHYAV
jgi:hypothetical protein